MNIRKIKLALTVDLLNLPSSQSPVNLAKSSMDNFSNETGGLREVTEIEVSTISDEMELSSIDMEYENCTLSLDLIRDKNTREEFLQNFNIQKRLS